MASNVHQANILLVDDRQENLCALEAVLGDIGHNLYKAQSSKEALRLVLHHDFAVILLDVQMPGIDGFETAVLIHERERSRHIPIIFLTALGTAERDILRGYASGAVDYLLKPLVPEILISKVTVFVELHLMRQRVRAQADELARVNGRLEEEIRQHRRAEEELQRRSSQLESVNKELEAFSYSVSHDLRAPLRHLDGFATLLRQHALQVLDAQGARYLQVISDSAKQMGILIDDLLGLARISRMELRKTSVNLNQLVQDVLSTLGPDLQQRTISWTIGDLPTAFGDHGLLKQVMINLVGNAVKYSKQREVAHIEVGRIDTNPEETVIYVRDDGAGFDMQYSHRLFGAFQRLHSASEFEGIGVGLANVQRIIHRHGGRTWAEGRVNEGATFYFALPILPSAMPESVGSAGAAKTRRPG